MKKLIAAVATASVLSFAGSAFAAGPVQLTNRQMDHVSAGGVGGVAAQLLAEAAGTLAAATESQVTLASAIQTPTPYAGPGTLTDTLTVLIQGFNAAGN